VYVVMAGLVGFFEAVPAALLVGLALGFEALLTLRSGWIAFATHAAFLALFAVIYRVVLNARLALARRAEEEAVKARIKEVEERARTYRLASAGSSEPAPDAGSQWMLAAVKQVEGAVGSVLESASSRCAPTPAPPSCSPRTIGPSCSTTAGAPRSGSSAERSTPGKASSPASSSDRSR
jgi:two-component system cell cycle response regulator